jgi:MFS transporter, MHS family, proline/betaine transporter
MTVLFENFDRPLNRHDVKTLVLAALGGALEFYDFVIFVFFAKVIGELFFPPGLPDWVKDLQSYGIFAAGYLARPFGGIVMAHFGDLAGRKRMFTLSVFLMAVPTFAIGLLPTYDRLGLLAPVLLLILRILQGAAIGGEIPGAWVFVAEHVPPRRTGLAVGSLTSGLTLGILLGSLIATGLNSWFGEAAITAYAWRLPFLIGGVFGLIAVFLRRWLDETPIFEAMRREKRLAEGLPLSTVLRGHGRAVIVSMLVTWLLTAAIVVVILMTPTLLRTQYHLGAGEVLVANCVASFCLSIGCILAGLAVDAFGVGPVLGLGSVLLAGSTFLLFSVAGSAPEWLVPAYGLAGLCVGSVGAVPSVLVRCFPPAVRFSGISASYNIAYAIFGGLTPVMIQSMIGAGLSSAPALYVGLLSLLGLFLGVTGLHRVGLPWAVKPVGMGSAAD